MADLGLHVIWYKGDDNHKELPQLLKRFTLSKKIVYLWRILKITYSFQYILCFCCGGGIWILLLQLF